VTSAADRRHLPMTGAQKASADVQTTTSVLFRETLLNQSCTNVMEVKFVVNNSTRRIVSNVQLLLHQ
jgi:hypothetical protein